MEKLCINELFFSTSCDSTSQFFSGIRHVLILPKEPTDNIQANLKSISRIINLKKVTMRVLKLVNFYLCISTIFEVQLGITYV